MSKRVLLRDHWRVFTLAFILGVIAVIGAVYVLVWHVNGFGFNSIFIGDLSMASVLWFVFTLILWELLFVGLPSIIIFGVGGYLWWSNLSGSDMRVFKSDKVKSRTREGGDAFSFFMFVAYIIYLLADGSFFTPFGDRPLSYWLLAYVWAFIWGLVLLGVPMSIVGLIYYFKFNK